MKKNVAAFVLALIGAITGFIGGILWTAFADACVSISGEGALWMVGFIVLGLGGSLIGLIGAIQAFGFKKGGLPLIALALVLQIGQLILACVAAESFAFVLNFWTLIAIVLFAIALFFARTKN